MRDAYAQASWAFGRGEGIEQCVREHYAERLDEQRHEGCRIEGGLRVNKVVGNFHLAPGRSFSNGNMHVHDLKDYWETPVEGGHPFTHHIHQLRFGPQLPEDVTRRLGGRAATPWTNHHINPLDGVSQVTTDPNFNFMYFVKVVPTSYLPLGWEKRGAGSRQTGGGDSPGLGTLGYSFDGSVETHQYSVTSHKRSLLGGDDQAEGHAERLHSRGGIPGVFFSYVSYSRHQLSGSGCLRCGLGIFRTKLTNALQDISPMKVINREERAKTFAGFVTGVCAVIGGTLTVAAAIDRGFYEGTTRLKKLRSKDL